MSHAMMLQDWITISSLSSNTVVQNESGWLDVSGYQDASFYFQLGGYTGGTPITNVFIQTSPTKDDAFFAATAGSQAGIAKFAISSSSTVGVQTLQISRWATEANQPLAKYLRWSMTFPGAATVSITFRIWVTLNQAGY